MNFTASSLIDITMPIGPGMPLYPGDCPPVIRRLSSIDRGDPLTASELMIGCHIGTHVDAPAHFIAAGATVGCLELKRFFGPARVLDLSYCAQIALEDVQGALIPRQHHILIKTRNSQSLETTAFDKDHCYVTPEAVEWLLQFDLLSIGFDYYSLDPPSTSKFPAHRLVAEAGLPVFVCLNLINVKPDDYTYLAFALPIAGIEGMPVRAFLLPAH